MTPPDAGGGDPGRANATWVYKASNFTRHLGLELVHLAEGVCRSRLPVGEELLNQAGTVHGGVYGVVADHTAGMASSTVVGEGMRVVTVEYKLNILRPRRCVELLTEATVVKGGKRIVYAEASVDGLKEDGSRELLCRAGLTFAVLPMPPERR